MNGWGPASDTFVDLKTVSAEKQYNEDVYKRQALTLLPTSTLDPNDKVGDALEWLTDERVLNGNHSFDTIYTDLYLSLIHSYDVPWRSLDRYGTIHG